MAGPVLRAGQRRPCAPHLLRATLLSHCPGGSCLLSAAPGSSLSVKQTWGGGGQDLPVWNKNRNVSAHVPRRNLHVYQRRTLSSPRWNSRRVLHGETEHSQRPNVQGWVCKLTCSAVC